MIDQKLENALSDRPVSQLTSSDVFLSSQILSFISSGISSPKSVSAGRDIEQINLKQTKN
jgi:hypothetical protein